MNKLGFKIQCDESGCYQLDGVAKTGFTYTNCLTNSIHPTCIRGAQTMKGYIPTVFEGQANLSTSVEFMYYAHWDHTNTDEAVSKYFRTYKFNDVDRVQKLMQFINKKPTLYNITQLHVCPNYKELDLKQIFNDYYGEKTFLGMNKNIFCQLIDITRPLVVYLTETVSSFDNPSVTGCKFTWYFQNITSFRNTSQTTIQAAKESLESILKLSLTRAPVPPPGPPPGQPPYQGGNKMRLYKVYKSKNNNAKFIRHEKQVTPLSSIRGKYRYSTKEKTHVFLIGAFQQAIKQ